MTLEEAIKHAEEVAVENEQAFVTFSNPRYSNYGKADECKACAEEHRQLAEWLKDYQRLLKAIDDIKAEINAYLQAEGFGSEYRNDVVQIIDKHIGKDYTE